MMNELKSKFLKNIFRRKTWLYITLGYFTFDFFRFHLSEKYRINTCIHELKSRFSYADKFIQNKPGKKKLCTIFPTNDNDIEKLLEIANNNGIAINNDINENSLKQNHIKLDFSKYNKILKLDSETITVQPGIKLSDLFVALDKEGYTIPRLENYKFTNLTIRDVLFNNYYSFIDGEFIDNLLNQITVIIPKGNKYLKLKQNDDIILSDLNLKSLFLRSNSTLGIITETKFNIKKKKEFKYISIDGVENNLKEVFEISKDLKSLDLGLKDLIVIKEQEFVKILLKLKKEKNCENFLSGLTFTELSENDFYKNLVQIYNSDSIIRKLKIAVKKSQISTFLNKLENYSLDNKISFKSNTLKNEIELIIKAKDNTIESIERGYNFIEKIQNLTRKKEMNIFSKILLTLS
jgi:hypothetical protein